MADLFLISIKTPKTDLLLKTRFALSKYILFEKPNLATKLA